MTAIVLHGALAPELTRFCGALHRFFLRPAKTPVNPLTSLQHCTTIIFGSFYPLDQTVLVQSMTEHAMQPPRSPDAEAPLASPALPDTVSEHAPQFSQEAHSSSAQKDADGLSLAGQEMLQQYMLKRFKTLELQLTLEQQRHRDHMEEELHKMQQHVVAAVQEQHQQQQHVSATVRETVEHMRKEFADALQYLAQDVAQRLRQAEEYTTRALNGLRDEMQHMLREHEQVVTRHQMQAASLATPSKPFPSVPEERQI